jgi:hypothetical protein
MQPLQPLASDINRMIRYLSGAGAGMSLLSISTSSLPSSMIQSMMLRGARANDVVGALVDGSIGCMTIRPCALGDEKMVEQSFIDRLQPAMIELCQRRAGGRVTLWLRAVHRPASDIEQAPDLIGKLFDAPSTPFTIHARSTAPAWSNPPILFPRVAETLDPFIEPVERQPTLLRLMSAESPWPPHFD